MKEIPLTQGKVTIVDDDDFAILSAYKWQAQSSPRQHDGSALTWYAVRTTSDDGWRTSKRILMHREILLAPSSLEVDHRDGDGLNNKRENLRLTAKNLQKRNSRPHITWKGRPKSSVYKGVSWIPTKQRWQAKIYLGGQVDIRKLFRSEIDAARVYNELALKYFGDFARLNEIP